jgi:hypothetical protein
MGLGVSILALLSVSLVHHVVLCLLLTTSKLKIAQDTAYDRMLLM